MMFDFIGKKAKRIAQLESEKFDLERALFEANEWVRIGQDKVKEWVDKHDALLIKHKATVAILTPEQKQQLDI